MGYSAPSTHTSKQQQDHRHYHHPHSFAVATAASSPWGAGTTAIQTEAGSTVAMNDVLASADRLPGHHHQHIMLMMENEKTMEESTTATAVTGQSHGLGDLLPDDDDDATTILSQESIVPGLVTGEYDDHHHHHHPPHETTTYLQVAAAHNQQRLHHHHHHHAASVLLQPGHRGNVSHVEAASTCSVSTAPSTDEASSMGGIGDWLQYNHNTNAASGSSSTGTDTMGNRLKQQQQHHRRTPSWESSPRSSSQYQPHTLLPASALTLPASSYAPSAGWQGQQQHPQQLQQNFATFRNAHHPHHHHHHHQGTAHTTPTIATHGHGTPPRPRHSNNAELPYLPRVGHNNTNAEQTPPSVRGGMYQRPVTNNPASYSVFHSVQQAQPRHRQFYGPPLPPSTPPRSSTTLRSPAANNNNNSNNNSNNNNNNNTNRAASASPHRITASNGMNQLQQQQQQQQYSGQNLVSTGPRSNSEVLKTLLRKKACLYESDTSRAVALVTWLVGRELALHQGFFSRQQLQSGVHACVAVKIDSGVITRTKVNRCMQIILNSCFHYIIPRPDGSEENGSCMRDVFAQEMFDDSFMLKCLPAPWHDLAIDFDHNGGYDDNSSVRTPVGRSETTPHSSPRFGSVQQQQQRHHHHHHDVEDSPVRDSVDGEESEAKRAVLLCFNDNVRSAADVFRCHNEFIRDTAHSCNLQLSSNEWRQFFGPQAAAAPQVWANIGIPVPTIANGTRTDALGMFTPDEAAHLRTSWCSKRYDHDHTLCGFAHAEVNGGWLRRNPNVFSYSDEMCPYVSKAVIDTPEGTKQFFVNVCPKGKDCEYAHSQEEIVYHPKQYKTHACATAGPCSLCEVCPHFHSWDVYRFPRKSDAKSQRHGRQGGQSGGKSGGSGAFVQVSGAPIVVARDAPLSSFEESMHLPGLQSLYRMQSNAVLSFLRTDVSLHSSRYSLFGSHELHEEGSFVGKSQLDRKVVGWERRS